MEHIEFSLTTYDGLKLFAQEWKPEDNLQAVVCLVHGLGEHSSRYAHLAQFLTRHGYALFTFDLRGHGKSQGPRGHIPNFEAQMKDLDRFFTAARERHPDLPCFLYGHSLGGLLVLNYVLRRGPDAAGAIVSSPGLRTALENQRIKVLFARLLGKFLPGLSLASGLDPRDLSRDADVVRRYQRDPLVHDRVTLSFANSNLDSIRWVFEHAHQFSLPLLMTGGTGDRLAEPRGSEEFAAQAPGEVTLKMWEGLYHEIHNEPEQEKVFDYILRWLDKKTEQYKAPVNH